MSSKARELANLGNAYSDGALSNRNHIINGNFAVWQRGTSFTGYNNYSADRWRVSVSTVPTFNAVDRVQDGNKNYARWQCTMPSGHLALFHQRIEGNPLAGKTVTVSFSAKGSGTLSKISFDQITGGVNSEVVAATGVALSATEQHYNFTVQLPSIASVPLATDQTRVQFFCSGSTSPIDMYITGVQLEVGDTATPFEHRSYGQELALCQRYYEVCHGSVRAGQYGSYIGCSVQFKQEKRVAPTLTNPISGISGGVSFNSYVGGGYGDYTKTAAHPQFAAASGGYIYGFQLTADAEL